LEWLKIRPENIFAQWAKTIGINDTDITEENYNSVIAAIKQKYQDRIDFVVNLPVVIETDEFICVHSALDDREDWQETLQWDAWFGDINKPNKTGKWIISGHSPNSLFSDMTLLPVIRQDNKTISIDGGSNTVFFGGQLNAFIIEKSSGSDDMIFSSDCTDKQSVNGIIIRNIEGKHNEANHEHLGNVEVLKKGEYFTECKIIKTGKICLVKNEHVREKIFDCWQPFANFLSVCENEIVSVIDNSLSGYAYIRNSKGELGWIPKESVDMLESN
jgi:protein phosphatase